MIARPGLRRVAALAATLSGLLAAASAMARADELTVRTMRALTPEECLDRNVGCPTLAGRRLLLGGREVAVVDELGESLDTLWCERSGSWSCRPIRVDRARGRATPAREVLRALATAERVELGGDFGLLVPPQGRPRTCGEDPARACQVQPLRLLVAGERGGRRVQRRLWLVEQDEELLACGDANLRGCDRLTASGWAALAIALRPSRAAPALPAPELDAVETRHGQLAAGPPAADGGEPAPGPDGAAVDPAGYADLPDRPRAAAIKESADKLRKQARTCVARGDRIFAVVSFDGQGRVVGIAPDEAHESARGCLDRAAEKAEFPRSRQALTTVEVVVYRD